MSLSANATPATPTMQLRLQAPSLPLSFLTGRLGLPGSATGNLALDANVTARGSSSYAMAGSLSGTLAVGMGQASVSNVTLRLLAQASLDALHITVPAAGQTVISCFVINDQFTQGISVLKTIALDSTYLQLVGAGQVNMGAETMALRVHPMARFVGSSVAVPVVVEGPWRTTHGTLDASGLDKIGLLLDGDTAKGCKVPAGSS
ncbi:AsmA family protein [Acidisoma cellulosilytica]|uniref:AsmA family protein n=1 Tax=Acidisoma cellulosilyticum TaxID=2802395 RepID=A0A963Z6R6_9PROT|nr:AsmA family protein [Acidisoma cellulosilyticum]